MAQIKSMLAAAGVALIATTAKAQQSVTGHYTGIVASAATLQPMAGASVVNRSRRVQVQCDERGRFDVPAGGLDTLVISHIGYEPKMVVLPATGAEGAAGVVLLRTREELLPGVTVRNRISAAEFGRDFSRKEIPIEKPMRFWDSASFHATMNSVSGGAGESAIVRSRIQHETAARAGQVPQVTLFICSSCAKFSGKRKRNKKREPRALFFYGITAAY
ncbi:MAG: hypothetical protein EOO16_15320 [Chitinophagaceae bacterium]|nr:MAG: hypothetical protein EOO16_15320 [Chitinophagaceae bacterium]